MIVNKHHSHFLETQPKERKTRATERTATCCGVTSSNFEAIRKRLELFKFSEVCEVAESITESQVCSPKCGLQ